MLNEFWNLMIMVFLAEFIGTIVIFGSSAIFLPVVLRFLNKSQSLGILSFFQVISNLFKIGFFFKKIDYKVLLYFGLPSIIMVLISSRLSIYVDGTLFKMILGWILLILIGLETFKNVNLPKNHITEFLGGIISGFVSGLIGTGGAIRGYFLYNFKLSKEVLIATYCIIDLSGDFVRLLVYIYNGYFDSKVIYYLPFTILSVLIANILGITILKFLPIKLFNRIILITLFVLAISLILNK
jgi:uncharacterized protein